MGIEQWKVSEPYVPINSHEMEDINSSKLYLIDLNKGPSSLREIDTGMPIGVTADIEGVDSSRVVLAGAKDGVTKFDLETGQHEYIAKFWSGAEAEDKARRMRSNDGAVDSAGRFWVEAFDDPEISEPKDEGVVFRLDQDGSLKTMHENMVIPNGITWNAEDNVMHLTDTTVGKIWAFKYDARSGDISDKKLFYQHEGPGNPDGHTIDADGNIWQALYGGSRVIRINPEGKVTGEVLLPTRNITCPVFAGTDLFITTAVEDEPDKYPESAKFAGNLFKVNVGVRGTSRYKARVA
ncbi:rRNA-processing protein cgr1 [Neophaeococcomyces mojaviensis]|uniref:rRNA-processing protein cgr1 n=1 Tax=Neophaeococcomyces mojaviensis TaxID=3383035 RepID=A0ACC3A6D6_9EURO|nr:rRNA-processing protein cgr1 [Knufia sp. JES_112]